jgi:hypothetical protein
MALTVVCKQELMHKLIKRASKRATDLETRSLGMYASLHKVLPVFALHSIALPALQITFVLWVEHTNVQIVTAVNMRIPF